MTTKIKWWYYAIAIIPPLCGAGNNVVAKYIHTEIQPLYLAYYRWLVALLVLLPFCLKDFYKEKDLIIKNFPILLIIASLGVSIHNTLVYYASHHTTSINMSIILSLFPIFVFIFSRLLLKTPLTLKHFFSILLSFTGTVIIVSKGHILNAIEGSFHNFGDYLILMAAINWGLYSVCIKLKPNELSAKSLFSNVVLGVMVLSPFYFYQTLTANVQTVFSFEIILILLFLGIVVSVIGIACYNFGTFHLGPNMMSLIFYVAPIFNILLAVIFLNEQLEYYHLIGIAFIFTGINMPLFLNYLCRPKAYV
jgi:drug/metabolite transporter (DMT)-like permease